MKSKHSLLKWFENNLVAKGIIIEYFRFKVTKCEYGDDYSELQIFMLNPVSDVRIKYSLDIDDEQPFNLGFVQLDVLDKFPDEIIKNDFNQDAICDTFIEKFGGKFIKSYYYNKFFRIPKDLIELEMEVAIDE